MSRVEARRPSELLLSILQGRTVVDLRPPVLPDASPAPEPAKSRTIVGALAGCPDAIEVPAAGPAAVARPAVLDAIARLEASWRGAGMHQAVMAPAITPEPFVPSRPIAATPMPWAQAPPTTSPRARARWRWVRLGVVAALAFVVLGYLATAALFAFNRSWMVATDVDTIAFAPFQNLESVHVGASVYACRFGIVMCRPVGTVRALLPGEVSFDHPHRGTPVRGVRIALQRSEHAAGDVLFVGSAPLGL
jgi:hypothetical protein